MAEIKTIRFEPARRGTPDARARPKGRPVDPDAAADVRRLLGDEPRRRDLLIEHLH
jgi:formate dehydrogenase